MRIELSIILTAMLFSINMYAYVQNSDSLMHLDSLKNKNMLIDGFAASSFFTNRNWKEMDNSTVAFEGALNLLFRKNGECIGRINEFHGELSYIKVIDSLWIKNNDNIF